MSGRRALPEDDGVKSYEKCLAIRLDQTPLTEETLAGRTDLEELHISGIWDDAVTLPANFFELTQLKKLCLSNIRLPEMPDLRRFHRLEVMSLFSLGEPDFEVEFLSPEASLVELDIRANSLSALPSWLAKHPRLEWLDAGRQRFQAGGLEPLRDLRALREVSLFETGLSEVPAFVAEWKQLEAFSVEGCALESFPSALADLTQLKKLDLSYNSLDGFPLEVLRFPRLEQLELAGIDELEVVPDAIGDLQALRDLNLGSTAVETLPASLTRLGKLEYLDLTETPIAGTDEDNVLGDAIVSLIQGFSDESPEARAAALEQLIADHDPDATSDDDDDD